MTGDQHSDHPTGGSRTGWLVTAAAAALSLCCCLGAVAVLGAGSAGGGADPFPSVEPTGWTLPLPPGSYQIGSGFGPRWGRLHAGVDLMATTGTPIRAAAAGVVLSAHCSSPYCDRPGSIGLSGCGWTVNVNHGGGIVTRYCHAIRLNVHTGQRVAAGDVLGWVGSTGNSSGPHLHFEVHRDAPPATNSNAVDPIAFLRRMGLRP